MYPAILSVLLVAEKYTIKIFDVSDGLELPSPGTVFSPLSLHAVNVKANTRQNANKIKINVFFISFVPYHFFLSLL